MVSVNEPETWCDSELKSSGLVNPALTPAKLRDVEELEALLRAGGLNVFRVRLHEDGMQKFLRLEVEASELGRALELRERFVLEGKNRGYRWVTLDLAGYRMGGGV